MVGAGFQCGADANVFIERWFADCIYSSWDTLAFCMGLSSVFFWLIAQLPQFINNFIRQSADALSPWFLVQWLAGDSFNLVGCLLTGDQLVTQTITAAYFIFADIVILFQYIYYQVWNKNALVDLDESVHKPSSGCDHNGSQGLAFKEVHANANAQEKVPETYPQDRCRDSQTLTSVICHQTSLAGENQNVNMQMKGTDTSPSKKVSFLEGSGEPSCSSDQRILPRSLVSESCAQSSWLYEHRHRLRRLEQEYGLEFGHEAVVRLNRLYKQRQRERCSKQTRLPRVGLATVRIPSVKARYKALLGMACIIGLAFQNLDVPYVSNETTYSGHVPRGRALLTLSDTLEIRSASPILLTDAVLGLDQSSQSPVRDQLLITMHPAFVWTKVMGRSLGWISSALYLGSRFSQLVKNRRRRSVEGLSLGMVSCAILANMTYGASILMRTVSWEYLIGKAPWVIGSLGTVFLDVSILIQAQYYSRFYTKGVPTEYTPLLA